MPRARHLSLRFSRYRSLELHGGTPVCIAHRQTVQCAHWYTMHAPLVAVCRHMSAAAALAARRVSNVECVCCMMCCLDGNLCYDVMICALFNVLIGYTIGGFVLKFKATQQFAAPLVVWWGRLT